MSWKDFFYLQKGSQVAVILLLILIVLTLIFNAFITNVNSSELVLQQNDSIINEFKYFNEQQRIVNYTANSNKTINSNLSNNSENYSNQFHWVESNKSNQSSNSKNYDNSNQSTHPNSYDNSEYYSKSHNYSASKTISKREVSANADVKNQRNYTNDNYIRAEKLSEGETISLNSSDTTEWKKIPGIGSSYSSRIVKYSALLGGFASKEQLLEVYGVEEDMYASISPYIEEDTNWSKLNINQLEFKELLRHPYLNYNQVQVIVNLRNKKGDITSLNELSIFDEFTPDDISRLKPYLEF